MRRFVVEGRLEGEEEISDSKGVIYVGRGGKLKDDEREFRFEKAFWLKGGRVFEDEDGCFHYEEVIGGGRRRDNVSLGVSLLRR